MSEAPVTRDHIIDALTEGLRALPWVRAAWLGGSDASGRTDRWSDVDLQMIVEDDRVEDAFLAVHAALEALSPIEHLFRIPSPTWHGHEQEFLSLRDAEPWPILDLLVMKLSAPGHFLERERHGEPLVLVDRDGIAGPVPLDREAHLERMRERLPALRAQFGLFQSFVTKAALRGAGADAMAGYFSFTLRPLIELLRMRHCPLLFDYGPRYLDRDLPEGVRVQVEELSFVPSLDRVEEYRARAEALFTETLRALDEGEWHLELPEEGAG